MFHKAFHYRLLEISCNDRIAPQDAAIASFLVWIQPKNTLKIKWYTWGVGFFKITNYSMMCQLYIGWCICFCSWYKNDVRNVELPRRWISGRRSAVGFYWKHTAPPGATLMNSPALLHLAASACQSVSFQSQFQVALSSVYNVSAVVW